LGFPPISNMHFPYAYAFCIPCPSHPTWLDHSNYVWLQVQVMQLLITQPPPTYCHFVSPWSKYAPQQQPHTPSVY
jgi:hypothetical protein